MVFVHNRGRYRFGLQGLKWLEIHETAGLVRYAIRRGLVQP